MSSKKRKSSCPFASAKKAPKRKKSGGGKVSKTFDQNWADALAASDKGSYFVRRRSLLALDEEDVLTFYKHYFITGLTGAFVVRSGNSKISAQSVSRGHFLHVAVYEYVRSIVVYSVSKLRRFKNRNG